MPNFNGAIIIHTLELLNSPATLREIVMTIAQNTDLPPKDIKLPVKETLEMGVRSGFLQKAEGRFYLEPIKFTRLMREMRALETSDIIEKPETIKVEKALKRSSKTFIQKIPSSEAIKNPKAIPKKLLSDGTHKMSNPKPKIPLNDDTLINSKLMAKKPMLDNISLSLTNKPSAASKKKPVISLTSKPRLLNHKQQSKQ